MERVHEGVHGLGSQKWSVHGLGVHVLYTPLFHPLISVVVL